MRKHFIDNIRWSTVIIVLIYHVFYLFNSVGVLGGIGGFKQVQYQDSFLYFVYPWFMALLFLIAGISSRYALTKSPCTAVSYFCSKRNWTIVVYSDTLFIFSHTCSDS